MSETKEIDRAAKQDQADEKEILSLGLTAPRVTADQIDALMAGISFHTYVVPGTTTTIAIGTAANGFTLAIGMSGCADPANFNAELGSRYAVRDAAEKARAKLWELEGWRLKCRLTDLEAIAKKCHEINRAYCAAMGDNSQLPWDQAPEWQRQSAINGVQFHVEHPDAGPDASHNSWLEEKRRDGWKFGPVKDADKKEHPCFVPYDQLPSEQKAKDYLFKGVVDQELGRA